MLAPTLADGLAAYYGGRSKVFGVAGKDRSAVAMAGQVGKAVGLKHTLVVLTADHGMADMPEYMTELGYKAGRLDPDQIAAAAKLDRLKVEHAIADALTDTEGIALAVAGSRLSAQPTNPLLEQVRNNHHVTRSGDIYVVQDPYWFNFDKGPVAGMHGSPWNYDTHVPMIFAGNRIKSQIIYRPVQPADFAPTLAALLRMSPPASAQGTVLPEVLNYKESSK
jgi:arylsulfatase A-like enzyme